jgi:transposase
VRPHRPVESTAKTYKFLAFPVNSCKPYLQHCFNAERHIYNLFLEHRLGAYKNARVYFSTYGAPIDRSRPKGEQLIDESQSACIKYIKEIFPEYSDVSIGIFHASLKTLDSAWGHVLPNLYQFERLNDIDYIEAKKEKKEKKKKSDAKQNGDIYVKKPIEPSITEIETKLVEIKPQMNLMGPVPEDIFKFNKHLKGANIRRDLSEGHPYVNTNRIENLKFMPGFKSKFDRQTITLSNSGWKLDRENNILILTAGKNIEKARIKFRGYRKIEGVIKTVSITHDTTHKWWVTFSCDSIPKRDSLPLTGKSVGIDFGVRNVVTLSTGEIIENPTFLINSSKNIVRAQIRLDKFKDNPTSRKYTQAKKWLNRYHEKIKNQRLYYARDLANKFVNRFDTIFLEKIDFVKLVQKRTTEELILDGWYRKGDKQKNKKAHDAGLAVIRDAIISAAKASGKRVVMVPSYYTSQTCMHCGNVRKKKSERLTLNEEVYKCLKCGLEAHRDINAAIVIMQRGQRMLEEESLGLLEAQSV